jgi:predicted small secreted protein
MKKYNIIKTLSISALLAAYLALSACNANIGVGLNVGVPIGNHGYMSIGTGRWH